MIYAPSGPPHESTPLTTSLSDMCDAMDWILGPSSDPVSGCILRLAVGGVGVVVLMIMVMKR